jgi:hypothetical protein
MEPAPVSDAFTDLEAVLKRALAPVDPPVELEIWELAGLRDPRNWPRAAIGPTAAVVVGGGAAVGLVLLRTQRRRPKRKAASRGALDLTARTVKDVAREALRVFDDLAPGR